MIWKIFFYSRFTNFFCLGCMYFFRLRESIAPSQLRFQASSGHFPLRDLKCAPLWSILRCQIDRAEEKCIAQRNSGPPSAVKWSCEGKNASRRGIIFNPRRALSILVHPITALGESSFRLQKYSSARLFRTAVL